MEWLADVLKLFNSSNFLTGLMTIIGVFTGAHIGYKYSQKLKKEELESEIKDLVRVINMTCIADVEDYITTVKKFDKDKIYGETLDVSIKRMKFISEVAVSSNKRVEGTVVALGIMENAKILNIAFIVSGITRLFAYHANIVNNQKDINRDELKIVFEKSINEVDGILKEYRENIEKSIYDIEHFHKYIIKEINKISLENAHMNYEDLFGVDNGGVDNKNEN